MYFFFIRHGDPIYNPDSLTEKGKEQAAALSKRFEKFGLDRIYSSTSERAIMTAEPTAKLLGKEIHLLDYTHENHAGEDFFVDICGKRNWAFLSAEYMSKFNTDEVILLGRKWYTHPDFKDTNFENGVKRVHSGNVKLMEELGYGYDEGTHTYYVKEHKYDRVALFAHGGFGMAFVSDFLDIPYPVFCVRFDHLSCTDVCVFKIPDEGKNIVPMMLQYGNDSHLYKENLARDYNGQNTF